MSVSFPDQEVVNRVTVEDAKTCLPDLIARVMQGEKLAITDPNGKTVAVLVPPGQESATQRWKAFGMMKGRIEIAADFDEPLEEFKPYTE